MQYDVPPLDAAVVGRRPLRFSIWFTLIKVTLLYLAAFAIAFVSGPRPGVNTPLPVRLLLGVTGMFVPFGVWNTIYGLSAFMNPFKGFPLAILAIPAAVFLLITADRRAPRSASTLVNYGYNLLFLFVITAVVDMLLYGHWLSRYILLTGDAFGGVH
jgi:hypothetical protein